MTDSSKNVNFIYHFTRKKDAIQNNTVMNILLIYPPPWAIPEPGHPSEPSPDGPPPGMDPAALLQGDILHLPAGLLSLAAQARRAGHTVEVLNLFTLPWARVSALLARRPADVAGLSCFTSNRRGTLALARLLRQLHPKIHIAVGGPHASSLAREMLEHASAIDTVICGEGEAVFARLLEELADGRQPAGIPGTAYRSNGHILLAAPQPRIDHLDSLAPACDYAPDHIVMTSRGCAWDCSFCASAGMWGKKIHSHSPQYVLKMLDALVNGAGQRALAIKDETFTLDRYRVLTLCKGIREQGLNFLWSCDTRADSLDRELLLKMRLAGCVRISLGLESASDGLLARIGKGIAPQDAARGVALARELGFQVRLYMIVGAPGETRQTLEESIAFVRSCRPTEVIWNPYTVFPGTRDFHDAVQRGEISAEFFFTENFFELTPLLNRDDEDARFCIRWLRENQGLRQEAGYSAGERLEILERLPRLHAAHLDLAAAWHAEGRHEQARASANRALQLEYPLPGLCHNLLACAAAGAGDLQAALAELIAAKNRGFHAVVERNIEAAQRWIKAGGPEAGFPLALEADCSFEITRLLAQPLLPGPVPE